MRPWNRIDIPKEAYNTLTRPRPAPKPQPQPRPAADTLFVQRKFPTGSLVRLEGEKDAVYVVMEYQAGPWFNILREHSDPKWDKVRVAHMRELTMLCKACRLPLEDHAGNKCLYHPTWWTP